jgi:hypothetical protein
MFLLILLRLLGIKNEVNETSPLNALAPTVVRLLLGDKYTLVKLVQFKKAVEVISVRVSGIVIVFINEWLNAALIAFMPE